MKRRFEATKGFALLGTLSVLLFVALVSDVRAAEVLALRIGIHEGYTRLVFEFDQASGHVVTETKGKQEVVVTLEAESMLENLKASLDVAALVRSLKSKDSLIGSLQIEPVPTGSRVRVQLVQNGLIFREMRLSNPPRFVLDVMLPKETVTKAVPPKLTVAPPTVAKVKPVWPRPAKVEVKVSSNNEGTRNSTSSSSPTTVAVARPAPVKRATGPNAAALRWPTQSSAKVGSLPCETGAEATDRVRRLEGEIVVLQRKLDQAIYSGQLARRQAAEQGEEIQALRATMDSGHH